jgi:glycosyltransferase
MKTCLINKLNGFDCRYKILADYELILKAYMNGASFKQIDKNIAKFNMGGISSCNFRNDYEKYLIHQKYASLKYPFLYFLLMICRKFLIVLKYQFTKLIQQ